MNNPFTIMFGKVPAQAVERPVQSTEIFETFVYEKIWSELSAKDKAVARAIAESDSGNVRQIREALNMTTNEFNPYRSRLKKKGVVQSMEYGSIAFTLPYFGEYVRRTYDI